MDENTALKKMFEVGDFEITPCDDNYKDNRFKKLDLDSSQKAKMSMLASQIPSFMASDALSNAYTLKFPKGISGTLMKYKDGGVGSAVLGEKGIVAHASFHEMSTYSSMLGAFSVMSVATGQFFLTEINNNLQIINKKIDQIMDFLYGEKKAELIAEVSFVKNAYLSFSSIMRHAEQRIATITSLQSAQKIAMKDIEFYLTDLNSKVESQHKSYNDFTSATYEAFRAKGCLELSVQLYALSNIMEVYFAQNTDADYLQNLKNNMLQYINKCDKIILSDFSNLNGQNNRFKPGLINKIDTAPLDKRLSEVVNSLNNGENSRMHNIIDSSISALTEAAEYKITKQGDVYIMNI